MIPKDELNLGNSSSEKCKQLSQSNLLANMSKDQIISFVKQLEEKNYASCPNENCRFIALSVIYIIEHILECTPSTKIENSTLCQYCHHCVRNQKILANHLILSHPDVADDSVTFTEEDGNVLKDKLKNPLILLFLKLFMRVCLQERGSIPCFTPNCHYVSSLIPVMENHFLNCTPKTWEKLKFQCNKCGGKTFNKTELAKHINECYAMTQGSLSYGAADVDTKCFWELSIKEIGASKCITKNCFYVSSQVNQLEEHYKYCRVPHKENYDVCTDCLGWFESRYDLESHKETFHCSDEMSSKMKLLVSLRLNRKLSTFTEAFTSTISRDDEVKKTGRRPRAPKTAKNIPKGVNYIGKPKEVKKIRKRRKAPINPAPVKNAKKPEKSQNNKKCLANVETKMMDVIVEPKKMNVSIEPIDEASVVRSLVNRKESHLEEWGKTIKLESKKETPITVHIAVGDQSWDVEAPAIEKANEVITRKLPILSMKNIATESLENSLNLLKLSMRTTKIENTISKPYFLPKPLDFVLENSYPKRCVPTDFKENTGDNDCNVATKKGKSSTIKKVNQKAVSFRLESDEETKSPLSTIQRATRYKKDYSKSSSKNSTDRVVLKTYKPLHKGFSDIQTTESENEKIHTNITVETSYNKVDIDSAKVSSNQKHSPLQHQIILDAIKKFGVDPSKISEVRVRNPNHTQVFNLKDILSQAVPRCTIRSNEGQNEENIILNSNESVPVVTENGDDSLEDNALVEGAELHHENVTRIFRTYSRVRPLSEYPVHSDVQEKERNTLRQAEEEAPLTEDAFDLPTGTENYEPLLLAGPDTLVAPKEEIFPYDFSEVPYELVRESLVAMDGGLYNDQFPWGKKVKSITLGQNSVLPQNPYRSSKLRGKTACEICQKEKPLNGSMDLFAENWCCCNVKSQGRDFNGEFSFKKYENVMELSEYLTKVKCDSFVNEPMIYVADKIVTGSTVEKSDLSKEIKNENKSIKGKKKKKLSINESKVSSETHSTNQSRKRNTNSEVPERRSRLSVPLPIKIDPDEEPKLGAGRRKRKSEAVPSNLEQKGVKKRRRSKKTSLNEDEPCSPTSIIAEDVNPSIKPNETIESTPGSSTTDTSFLNSQQDTNNRLSDNQEDNETGKNTTNSNNLKRSLKSRRSKSNPRKIEVSLEKTESSEAQIKVEPEEECSPTRRPPSKKRKSGKPQTPAAEKEDDVDQFLYQEDDQQLGNRAPVPADQRITYNSKITAPHKLVVCAVCGDNMTVFVYKNTHMAKHNYICWLVGEEPMNVEDESFLERYLYKIYINTKAVFKCENCGTSKKSAQGFLSHRRMCGKSLKERSEILVSCKLCSRMLLPVSLPYHMARNHAEKKTPADEIIRPLSTRRSQSSVKMAAAISVLKDNTEFIDEAEEINAAANEEWIKSAYSYCKRRVSKHVKTIMEDAATKNGDVNCIIEGCTFSNTSLNDVLDHYKLCDKLPLDMKCHECQFFSSDEARIINHVRMTHRDKADVYANKRADLGAVGDTSEIEGTFIPYVKSAELNSRSLLYLQSALYWTDYLQRNFLASENVFPDWKPDCSAQLKTLDQFPNHIDLKAESMRVAFDEKKLKWRCLEKLSTHSFTDDAVILYAGGAIRTFDWFSTQNEQYMAISVGSPDYDASIKSVHSGPGHFQVWSAGSLDNFSEQYLANPKFKLALCHDFGEIWDLQCCPNGFINDERLGAVAIATSSGKVVIYAIPDVDSTEQRAFMPAPTLVLKLGTSESHQVTKISWSSVKPHRLLAAGYSNGFVAVWDLTSNSSILKSRKCLLPFKIFPAHLNIITALRFCPINEYYLVTGCSEKSCKQWNLHDTSTPQSESNKGLVTDATWMSHWMSVVTALDDNYTTGTTTLTLNPLRNFVFQSQSMITLAESTPLTVSVNDWINAVVCGYDNGQVVLNFGRKQISAHDDRKKVVNCILAPEWHDFDPKTQDTSDSKSYSDTCKRFGIIFKHNYKVQFQSKFKSQPCRDMAQCPSLPANKVVWNPNRNSFLTLATGFQSGFVIISRIKLPANELRDMAPIVNRLNEECSS